MLAVHVCSVATGQELCTISAGRDWTVHELNVKVATQLGTKLHSQTFLQGPRVLESTESLKDFLETEDAKALELQLLRKSWVVTVDYEDEAVDIEAYPECTLQAFGVLVADRLQLPAATRPAFFIQKRELDWDSEAESSLADLGIQPGVTLQVPFASSLNLMCKGRPALQSRRSEFLESNAALCLIDQCQEDVLLPHHEFCEDLAQWSIGQSVESLHPGTGEFLCDSLAKLPQLFTQNECRKIVRFSEKLAMAPMDVACFRGTCRYQRVVVRDETLARKLWERAEPYVHEALEGQSLRPLGFGCAQGDWELEGLNDCFRVNSYGPGGFLKPHRDAPFAQHSNLRSLCTLLIPLDSVGRTRFFHPVKPLDFRGMTLNEELEARGGLAAGFEALDVRLSAGRGLLFGQLTDAERKDHAAALQWFREAQHRDLKEEPSNDLYERALSYRYFHPRADAEASLEAHRSTCAESRLWEDPGLPSNSLLEEHKEFTLPDLVFRKGPVAAFRLSKTSTHAESGLPSRPTTAKHLRASAMYALHLLGHHAYGPKQGAIYTVDFDPKNQQVAAVPLPDLLQAAFDARPCFGAVYNVAARHGTPELDLEAAVDRTHMALQHGCPHVGQDLLAGFKSEAYVGDDSTPDANLREASDDFQEEEYQLEDFNKKVLKKYKEAFSGHIRAAELEELPKHMLDWQNYLSNLLAKQAGVPGLDLIATAAGVSYISMDYNGDYEPRDENIRVESRPMNHLVFDFNKHQLDVRAFVEMPPPRMFYDPEALWLELLEQWSSFHVVSEHSLTLSVGKWPSGRSHTLTLIKDTEDTLAILLAKESEARKVIFDMERQACRWTGAYIVPRKSVEVLGDRLAFADRDGVDHSYDLIEREEDLKIFLAAPGHAFERYEVSLAELSRPGAGYHHAGEMNGVNWYMSVQVEHAGLAVSDHTTTVLCGVAAEPESGDAEIWTVYHGLSAL
ncbi:unnamed protein product [Symbiodinium microadriaticum]|nr:unnamed protein product [Symbiodinium microadriaticum]